jgi:NitT/TauT family transport system substrate-binding protein
MKMKLSRRTFLKGTTGTLAVLACVPRAFAQSGDKLQKIVFAQGSNAIQPSTANTIAAQYLGFFAEEGLDVEHRPVGSLAAAAVQLESGEIQFTTGGVTASDNLIKSGAPYTQRFFFEYTYPFKWGLAVRPDSKYQSLSDAKGAIIGVPSFGNAEHLIGGKLLSLVGLDKDKDVNWLQVGGGTTAGLALKNGQCDILIYFDTGFAQIQDAGIEMRMLPLPDGTPQIGGIFISTSQKMIADHPEQVLGFARGVLKGNVYTAANPDAAAYAYLQMYPEAAPRGKSLAEQVDSIAKAIRARAPLYQPPKGSDIKLGYIRPSEIEQTIEFDGMTGQVDPDRLYTNEFIDKAHEGVDLEAIRQKALDFKLPG